MNCDIEIVATTEDALFKQVATLIEESRKHVAKAVNTAMVYTYYGVGQYIVDYEQGGNYRAAYGKGVLARLSAKLTNKYGRGWSVETLTKCRKFYNIYAISSAPQTESTGKANSSDGQTKMYVNYFDRYVKLDFEKPTIGILLCKAKEDALVELTLPKEANIYASAYQLCLPDKALLQAKVKEWIDEFEDEHEL